MQVIRRLSDEKAEDTKKEKKELQKEKSTVTKVDKSKKSTEKDKTEKEKTSTNLKEEDKKQKKTAEKPQSQEKTRRKLLKTNPRVRKKVQRKQKKRLKRVDSGVHTPGSVAEEEDLEKHLVVATTALASSGKGKKKNKLLDQPSTSTPKVKHRPTRKDNEEKVPSRDSGRPNTRDKNDFQEVELQPIDDEDEFEFPENSHENEEAALRLAESRKKSRQEPLPDTTFSKILKTGSPGADAKLRKFQTVE
uniref:Nucleolar protein 58-like n=1 Tax=Crassostrea virginica TaxID=6565 RepID=A0A8B8DVC4_CRAVI|nr:nucleolar protein 58-like [Crassostrea virginica]